MHIFVNNEKRDVTDLKTLSELLESVHLNLSKGIAVAINNQVVAKGEWSKALLKENDKITIIRATQGG